MYGKAPGIGVGGRARGVEQYENAEIASEFSAFGVDVFRWRVAGAQIDEKVDKRLDVELVAIGTTPQNLGAEADARETSLEHAVMGDRDWGHLDGRRQREIDDPAPIG